MSTTFQTCLISLRLPSVPPISPQSILLCVQWDPVITNARYNKHILTILPVRWCCVISGCRCAISHHTLLYNTTPHHTEPHHTMPHHTTQCHTTPHHTMPHHTTPHHTIPHHTKPTPHQTTPHHTTPHHTKPHHTMPHHTTPHHTLPVTVPWDILIAGGIFQSVIKYANPRGFAGGMGTAVNYSCSTATPPSLEHPGLQSSRFFLL